MSKVFSISLTTLLLLVGMIGPVQPATFADDPLLDPDPTADQLLIDESPDGDEALEEEVPEPADLPAEEEPVEESEEDLAPNDQPEESANSPPASDEPVIDEPAVEEPVIDEEPIVEDESTVDEPIIDDEPVVEEDPVVESSTSDVPVSKKTQTSDVPKVESRSVISPSAVDPNPGECGGIGQAPCPGSGEDPQNVTVTITVKQPYQVSQGAVVVVRDSGNAEVGSNVTDANGVVQFDLTVGETYSVDVTKNGFSPRTGVSLTVSGDTPSLNINLQPLFGKITVSVKDSVTDEPVTYAVVRFTKKPGTLASVNTNSGSTGVISPSLESGDYVAFFSKNGYVSKSFDITITVGDVVQVQLDPEVEEPVIHTLSVLLVDSDTGEPVPDADVSLRQSPGWQIVVQGKTDLAGEWTSPAVEDGEYILRIQSPYHRAHSSTLPAIPSGVLRIEVERLPAGSLTVNLTDVETGQPVSDALVTMVDEHSGVEVASGRSDGEGTWTSVPFPGASYIVTIQADGYQTVSTTRLILSDHTWNISLMPPGYAGSMFVLVRDAVSFEDIVGATITVSNGDDTQTFTSDEDGFSGELRFAPGTWEVTVEANGYQPVTIEEEVESGRDVYVYAELEARPGANLTIQLQAPVGSSALMMTSVGMASGAGMTGPTLHQVPGAVQPIAGATIQVVNPDTGLVMTDGVTDEEGFVTLAIARQGTYQLIVSVEGYEPYSEPYELNEDSDHMIMLQPIVVDDPGEGTTPDLGEPDQGSDPGTGNPDDGSDPGTGDPDEGTEPGTGEPDEGTDPGTGEPDEGTDPGTGDSDTGSESESPGVEDGDNGADAQGEDVAEEAVAQAPGASTDASAESVSRLPNTGAGESGSSVAIAAITLVAACTLMGALGIRRRA